MITGYSRLAEYSLYIIFCMTTQPWQRTAALAYRAVSVKRHHDPVLDNPSTSIRRLYGESPSRSCETLNATWIFTCMLPSHTEAGYWPTAGKILWYVVNDYNRTGVFTSYTVHQHICRLKIEIIKGRVIAFVKKNVGQRRVSNVVQVENGHQQHWAGRPSRPSFSQECLCLINTAN